MSEQNKKDRWWIPLVVGLIAFVGSALGAALPRLSFEGEETRRKLLEARLDAYNDFFKGQAQKQVAGSLRDVDPTAASKALDEYSQLVKGAKFRIGAYGTQSEIDAITDYFRKYLSFPPCEPPRQKWLDDIKTYHRIREGVFRGQAGQQIDDARLILLLFDCELQE